MRDVAWEPDCCKAEARALKTDAACGALRLAARAIPRSVVLMHRLSGRSGTLTRKTEGVANRVTTPSVIQVNYLEL
jgi:alcohol dehydrogenase class IV